MVPAKGGKVHPEGDRFRSRVGWSGSSARVRRFPRCLVHGVVCTYVACGSLKMGIQAVPEADGGEERPEVLERCVG